MKKHNLRQLPSTRKPSSWADVTAVVERSALPADLPRLEASAVDGNLELDGAAHRAAGTPQYFLVEVEGTEFLVNTEGYDYVRYAARVADSAQERATKTRERFQTFETEVLLAIAKGEISAVEAAKHELAARGLGAKGTWIGFARAAAFWRTAFWTTDGTLVTVPQDK